MRLGFPRNPAPGAVGVSDGAKWTSADCRLATVVFATVVGADVLALGQFARPTVSAMVAPRAPNGCSRPVVVSRSV